MASRLINQHTTNQTMATAAEIFSFLIIFTVAYSLTYAKSGTHIDLTKRGTLFLYLKKNKISCKKIVFVCISFLK